MTRAWPEADLLVLPHPLVRFQPAGYLPRMGLVAVEAEQLRMAKAILTLRLTAAPHFR